MYWLGCLTSEHQALPVSVIRNAEVTSMPLWLDFTRALGIQTHVLIKHYTDWAIYQVYFCFALYTYKPTASDITVNTAFSILHIGSQWPWFMCLPSHCFWKHLFSMLTYYCLWTSALYFIVWPLPHSTVLEASMQTFLRGP